MVRKTSIEARRKIEENGLLSRLKLKTYLALDDFGPCTAGELFNFAGWNHSKNNHNISSRLGELRDLGCVDEVGERPCTTTGHTQIVWQTNGGLPNRKPKTKKIKCQHCNGTGSILVDEENQCLLF